MLVGARGVEEGRRTDCGSSSQVPRGSPPHYGSALLFPNFPQPICSDTPTRNTMPLMLGGLHPSLEGRGQVAVSLRVEELIKN